MHTHGRVLLSLAAAVALVWATLAGAQPPNYSNVPPGYPNTVLPATPAENAWNANAPPNNFGPVAPTAPQSRQRPAAWPGGPQDQSRQGPPPAYPPGTAPPGAYPQRPNPPGPYPPGAYPPGMNQPVAAAPRKSLADPPYDPALIMARVGSFEVVQANEVLPMVRKHLDQLQTDRADQLALMSPEDRREVLLGAERNAMSFIVHDTVKLKLLMAEVRAKGQPEALKKNEEHLRKLFNERMIKQLLAEYNATTTIELENKLRQYGTSLETQRTLFVERQMGIGWFDAQHKSDPEPTHEQLLTYYRAHPTEWETPARARWEHLAVKFEKFATKEQARAAIAQWGDEIWHGAPFAAVAKAHSHDFSASDGGLNDWTVQASLRSTPIDEALFALPVGTLSRILEDDDGYHIVRVLERTEARRAAFVDVQDQIRAKMFDGSRSKALQEYIEKLREQMPVWTVFDEAPEVANGAGPARR